MFIIDRDTWNQGFRYNPTPSMYGTLTYINVGKYTIHGCYGKGAFFPFRRHQVLPGSASSVPPKVWTRRRGGGKITSVFLNDVWKWSNEHVMDTIWWSWFGLLYNVFNLKLMIYCCWFIVSFLFDVHLSISFKKTVVFPGWLKLVHRSLRWYPAASCGESRDAVVPGVGWAEMKTSDWSWEMLHSFFC